MNENKKQRHPDEIKGMQKLGKIKDVTKKIYARMREMLQHGVSNSVWANGGKSEKFGGSHAIFSGGGRAEK